MGSILVLGGAGYIGSHTVYELIDAGENVVIVDNLLTGFRKAVHPEAKFYQGDIRDRAFMDSVFEKEDIDGVIHFAASSQVGESMKDPLKYYSNNLCGTEVLLESMVAHGIDKIVFSSTAATYGEPGEHSNPGNRSDCSDQLLWRNEAVHGKNVPLDLHRTQFKICFPALL